MTDYIQEPSASQPNAAQETAPGAAITHDRLSELLERLNAIEKLAYEIHMTATGRPPYDPKPPSDIEKREPSEGFFPITNDELAQANSKADIIEVYLRKILGEF